MNYEIDAKQMIGPGARYWVGGMRPTQKGAPWQHVCSRTHDHKSKRDAMACIERYKARLDEASVDLRMLRA
jgi:hypothetical protein